eukprot:TRINITY_DN3133_c0_g2_i1.p1 TRINITY_DN3133_c0_g2~~TRINITY_DN3133_c0_g2_i1.p1  ORF type:complete len:366 (-),score=42.24 TRINITY_DN3133_c0_g2_i1:49-1146(-)
MNSIGTDVASEVSKFLNIDAIKNCSVVSKHFRTIFFPSLFQRAFAHMRVSADDDIWAFLSERADLASEVQSLTLIGVLYSQRMFETIKRMKNLECITVELRSGTGFRKVPISPQFHPRLNKFVFGEFDHKTKSYIERIVKKQFKDYALDPEILIACDNTMGRDVKFILKPLESFFEVSSVRIERFEANQRIIKPRKITSFEEVLSEQSTLENLILEKNGNEYVTYDTKYWYHTVQFSPQKLIPERFRLLKDFKQLKIIKNLYVGIDLFPELIKEKEALLHKNSHFDERKVIIATFQLLFKTFPNLEIATIWFFPDYFKGDCWMKDLRWKARKFKGEKGVTLTSKNSKGGILYHPNIDIEGQSTHK